MSKTGTEHCAPSANRAVQLENSCCDLLCRISRNKCQGPTADRNSLYSMLSSHFILTTIQKNAMCSKKSNKVVKGCHRSLKPCCGAGNRKKTWHLWWFNRCLIGFQFGEIGGQRVASKYKFRNLNAHYFRLMWNISRLMTQPSQTTQSMVWIFSSGVFNSWVRFTHLIYPPGQLRKHNILYGMII